MKEKKEATKKLFLKTRSGLRSDPKLESPKKTPLLSSGPKPVKSGRVAAGPTFDVVSALPGAYGETADVAEGARDNQEELVTGDTPPGLWAGGNLPEEHDEVSSAGVLAQAGWAAAPLGCSSQQGLAVEGTRGNFFETVADPDAAPVGGEPFWGCCTVEDGPCCCSWLSGLVAFLLC